MSKQRLPSQTARIAADLMDKAHFVCACSRNAGGDKLRLSDLIDSILRPVLERLHAEALEQIRQPPVQE